MYCNFMYEEGFSHVSNHVNLAICIKGYYEARASIMYCLRKPYGWSLSQKWVRTVTTTISPL